MQQTYEKRSLEQVGRYHSIPPLPPWPVSRPGPYITDPPPGMVRLPTRTDQVMEVGYNAEQGKSGARPEL